LEKRGKAETHLDELRRERVGEAEVEERREKRASSGEL